MSCSRPHGQCREKLGVTSPSVTPVCKAYLSGLAFETFTVRKHTLLQMSHLLLQTLNTKWGNTKFTNATVM